MSRFILPHLQNRPVTLKRYPDEASGQFFYEKDAPAFTPKWVKTFPVWRRSGESQINYIVVNDAATLVWAAEMGTLEFHTFLARVPDLMTPTEVVFDLDPGEDAGILDCAHVALLLRDLLQRVRLESLAKVSGSKGIQVYVPLNTATTYSVTQAFAKTVAEFLEREHRDTIVAHMERAERKHKVFIDWSQNADYKTTVAVYSLRAKRRHPYISMPVAWDELAHAFDSADVDALVFRPEAALARLERIGDLFARVETLKQQLPAAFTKLLGGRAASRARMPQRSRARIEKSLEMPRRSAQGGRRRFVLEQESSSVFRLTTEIADLLRSWRLEKGLLRRKGQAVPAIEQRPPEKFPAIENDERVQDFGICELIEGNYQKGHLRLFLQGTKNGGEWLLTRDQGRHWQVSKPQASVVELNVAPATGAPPKPTTRRAVKPNPSRPAAKSTKREPIKYLPGTQIELQSLPQSEPHFATPMECRLVNHLPEGEDWLYELKLDGYRAIAVKNRASVQLLSRHRNDLGPRFAHVIAALERAALMDVVLDGETVALDERGRPSFQRLQNTRNTVPIVYYVFDVLHYAGRDLQNLPLATRKQALHAIAREFIDPVRLSEVLHADASTLVEEVTRRGLEGIVAKRKTSVYEAGKRSGQWQKFRTNEKEVFMIGGYLPGPHYFEAVLVGRMEGNKLKFIKKLRNGFVPETREQVFRAIEPLRIPKCPFVNLPEPKSRRGAVDAEQMKQCVWVEPKVKCEVDFTEWTAGGRLRHAAFRRLVGVADTT